MAVAAGALIVPRRAATALRLDDFLDYDDESAGAGEADDDLYWTRPRRSVGVVPPVDSRHNGRPPSARPDPRVRVLIFEKPEESEDEEEGNEEGGGEGSRSVDISGRGSGNAADERRKREFAGARRQVRRRPRDYSDAVLVDEDVPLRARFFQYLELAGVVGSVAGSVAIASTLSERATVSRAAAVPLEYDRKAIAHYCMVRPELVVLRLTKFACEIAQFGATFAWHTLLDGLRMGGERASVARLRIRARKLREGITRLGPGVIKLGQAAATRPDLFGYTYARELQLLQDSILEGFDSREAFALIRDELGAPAEALFQHISPRPVAGASLGTVFKATLADDANWRDLRRRWRRERLGPEMLRKPAAALNGPVVPAMASIAVVPPVPGRRMKKLRRNVSDEGNRSAQSVAVKVQRPNVAEMMTLDFFIVRNLAELACALLNVRTDLGDVVDEYASSVFEELNYLKEAANMQRFRAMYENMPGLYVPEVFPLYSSRRVLVTEWIDGEKLIDRKVRVRPEDIATTVMGIRNALTQFLDGGFTHCDLHNGNILRLRDTNQLAFIDFGVCASMPEYTRHSMSCAIMHLIHCDYYALAASFAGMSLMRASDLAEELPVLADALRDEFEVVGAEYASEKTPSEATSAVGVESGSFVVVDSHSGDQEFAKDNSQVLDSSDEPKTQQVPFADEGPRVVPIGLDRHFSFIGVVEKLIKLSGKFPFKFGDYFLSNIKCLAMLEGLALNSDPDFNILEIVYPFVVSKVLTDPALPFQDARRELMLDVTGRVRLECVERLVRTRNESRVGRKAGDFKRVVATHNSDEPCEVVEFLLSRDGCLIRCEFRRQFIADWCAMSTTWLDRHVFRRWDMPAGRGGRRSWWWSTSRASAAKRRRERATAVRAISRARDNWCELSLLLGATRHASLLRRARLFLGLAPVAVGCVASVIGCTVIHAARRCVGVLARAIATAVNATHKLWLAF